MYLSFAVLNSRFLVRSCRLPLRYTPICQSTVSLTSHSKLFSFSHGGQSYEKTFHRYNNFSRTSNLNYVNSSHNKFSSKAADGNDHNQPPADEDNFDGHSQLPATVVVPEVWPHVPVIAVSRNIVFPRFIKLIEVSKTKKKFYSYFILK